MADALKTGTNCVTRFLPQTYTIFLHVYNIIEINTILIIRTINTYGDLFHCTSSTIFKSYDYSTRKDLYIYSVFNHRAPFDRVDEKTYLHAYLTYIYIYRRCYKRYALRGGDHRNAEYLYSFYIHRACCEFRWVLFCTREKNAIPTAVNKSINRRWLYSVLSSYTQFETLCLMKQNAKAFEWRGVH